MENERSNYRDEKRIERITVVVSFVLITMFSVSGCGQKEELDKKDKELSVKDEELFAKDKEIERLKAALANAGIQA